MVDHFQPTREFWWGIGVAVATVLFQAAVDFDPYKMGDPRLWLVGVLSGAVRAAGGAALAYLTRPRNNA